MGKRYITKQQQARITRLQNRRLQRAQLAPDITENSQNLQSGLLVAHYGTYVDVETEHSRLIRCNLRQHLGTVVAGDHVLWQDTDNGQGIVVAIKPRKTLFSRTAGPGKIKPLAANLDQVLVIIATEPKPAANIIDSYLVAIEKLKLQALLVCNKSDLIDPHKDQDLLELIALYQSIGYPVLLASTLTREGLTELMACLRGQTSILVGQSAVGKTSLLTRLLPETLTPTTDFTAASDHGTHTTTTARLYHLPSGGELIDSPGIRDFVLWDMPANEIAQGFIEFTPHLGQCQFRNCRHFDEPNCALTQAAAAGAISTTRLASYRRIVLNTKI